MIGWRILVGKELTEQVRTLRLPVLAIVFLFVGLSSPLLARYTPELIEALAPGRIPIEFPTPTAADAVDQLLKNILQFGGLAAVLLAMGAVASEKERGTAALIRTTPASRAAFLAAKAVALGTTLATATSLAFAAAWIYTTILFRPLPIGGFVAAAGLVWLVVAAYGALTLLASTVVTSAVAAGALGFGAFLVLSILGALPAIGDYLPSGLLGPARAVALGEPTGAVAGPILATTALIVVAIIAAWVAFRGQEL